MQDEIAMKKLVRYVHGNGGRVPVSALKDLYDAYPWMKGAIGNLQAFCSNGPIAYAPRKGDSAAISNWTVACKLLPKRC